MAILDDQVRSELQRRWSSLDRDVNLHLFRGPNAEAADVMEQLLTEMAQVSDRVHWEHDEQEPELEPGATSSNRIEGPVLGMSVQGQRLRIRFLGVTLGMEFGSLVDAIRAVASPPDPVEASTRDVLDSLRRPAHLLVFTTPT